MAARHLRRLREVSGLEDELDPLKKSAATAGAAKESSIGDESDDDDATSSPSDGRSPVAASKPFNPFDLLDDGEDDDGGCEESGSDGGGRPSTPPPETSTTASKKKKKKKKKAKGKGGEAEGESLDEVDAAMRELGLKQQRAGGDDGDSGDEGAPPSSSPPPLLSVDPRALRGDDERRRLFGIGGATSSGSSFSSSASLRNLLGGRALPPGSSKAAAAGGLSMTQLAGPPPASRKGEEEEERSLSYFAFEANSNYEAGLTALEVAQAQHDPSLVASLLRSRPRHAATLLVVYDLCRLTAQHEQADDALSEALSAFEAAFHPGFAAAAVSSRARLASDSPSSCSLNRLFLLALFRRAASLSRRSLHGAALETAKLALSLDPTGDPMGLALCVDYFALRAGDAAFVVAAGDGGASRSALSSSPSLPNWAFSVPLARMRLAEAEEKRREEEEKRRKKEERRRRKEDEASKTKKKGGGEERPPTGTDVDPRAERTRATTALTRAVSLYPLAVVRLAERLAEAKSPPGARLSAALARRPFSDAEDDEVSPSLSRLCDLFAERHHPVWKQPDAALALAEACEAAAGQHESGSSVAGAYRSAREALFPRGGGGGGDAYSHLTPLDFSDVVAPLPEDELNAMNAAGLLGGGQGGGGGGGGGRGARAAAPAAAGGRGGAAVDSDEEEELDEEELERRELEWALAAVEAAEAGGDGAGGGAAAREDPAAAEARLRAMRERGPLAALLQTLLPWEDAPGGGGGGGGDDEGGEEEGSDGDA